MSPVAYRITLPENWRIHNVIHISRLRPWHEKTEVRTEPAELPAPPPPVQDDKLGEFYTVEQILKKERDPKTKRLKFLVKFTGYDDSENMWLSWYDFTPDKRTVASTMHAHHRTGHRCQLLKHLTRMQSRLNLYMVACVIHLGFKGQLTEATPLPTPRSC